MPTKKSDIPGVGKYTIGVHNGYRTYNSDFPKENGRPKLFSAVKGPGPGDHNICSVNKYKANFRSNAIRYV